MNVKTNYYKLYNYFNMINIDTRILRKLNPDQLYLLCHIVNFMNENRMCFPSNKKLIEQSGFSESKILRVKNDLVTRNIISVKKRFRPDGSQTSNLYRIETDLIGVFVTGKNMSNLEPHPFTDEDGGIFTHEGGTPLSMKGHEVLTNLSINHKEVLSSKNSKEFCQNEKEIYFEDLEEFPIFPSVEIKSVSVKKNEKQKLNPFQVVSDVEKERKENFAPKEKKEKEAREPNEIYQAYECFCLFHESVTNVKYPRTLNGNFIINPIDSRNIKLLLTWIKTVSQDNPMDNLNIFLKGVWLLNDKYINANFSIGLLYRQCTSLYAKVQTLNPITSKQKLEEQRNAEAAEFLRERYGIIN